MAAADADAPAAAELKALGNTAHQAGEYRQAIHYFSRALEADPGSSSLPVLHSNRSAAFCLFEDYPRALLDAEAAVHLRPDWPKGYSRKASALHHMRRYPEAIEAYQRGLELDPGNPIMGQALAEAEAALAALTATMFSPEVRPETTERLKECSRLRLLAPVVWHLEIVKDRIWLADPPRTPFRPRSLFLIDAQRLQLLNMISQPTRESVGLDRLLGFLADTFLKAGVRPGQLEVSDAGLQRVLHGALSSLDVAVVQAAPSLPRHQFFANTVRVFEETERQQWSGSADGEKFAGVLQQRRQKPLMSVPGVTPSFLEALLSAAASFLRTRAYLYYTRGLGIHLTGVGAPSVCIITRNQTGQYGLSRSTLEEYAAPGDTGDASFLFCEPSHLPFDDVDQIDVMKWDVADDKYPLPVLHGQDPEEGRPPLDILEWFEIAFRLSTLFIAHTFAVPTFAPKGPLCYECRVQTSKGLVTALVSAPPTASPVPQGILEEGAPGIIPLPMPPRATPDSSPGASPNVSPTLGPHSRRSPSNSPRTAPLLPISTAAPTAVSAALRHVSPASQQAVNRSPSVERTPCGRGFANSDTAMLQAQLKAERQRSAKLEDELQLSRSQVQFYRRHTQQQKVLIDGLEAKVRELDTGLMAALKEVRSKATPDAAVFRQTLGEMATRIELLVKGLASADHVLASWHAAVIGADGDGPFPGREKVASGSGGGSGSGDHVQKRRSSSASSRSAPPNRRTPIDAAGPTPSRLLDLRAEPSGPRRRTPTRTRAPIAVEDSPRVVTCF